MLSTKRLKLGTVTDCGCISQAAVQKDLAAEDMKGHSSVENHRSGQMREINEPLCKGQVLETQAGQENEDSARYYATAMFVRFTSYQDRVACGELSTPYLQESFSFHGLDQLLLLMEDIMDFVRAASPAITFPQAWLEHRSLRLGKAGIAFQAMSKADIIPKDQAKPETRKTSISFVAITVYYRQHASMQGDLRVAGQKVFFRSGLELIRLIHQALNMKKHSRKSPNKNT